MQKMIANVVAIVLIVVGFVAFWLPIPVGAMMMVTGGAILFGHDPRLVNRIRDMRKKRQSINRFMVKLQSIAPEYIGQIMEASNPGDEQS